MTTATATLIDTCVVLGTAWRYMANGLAVLPIEPSGKRPVEIAPGRRFAWKPIRSPQSFEAIERLFPQHLPRNLAIICGAPSGGLDVLDLDGALALENVLDAVPVLRETWIVKTGRTEPGPGYHIFIRASGSAPTITGGAFRTELGLDVKGEGGYVVADPSLHASGRFYETIQGDPEGIANVGDCRSFLTGLLRGLGIER